MSSVLTHLDEHLKAAMRARHRVRVEALRTLKAALWGSTSEREVRTQLGRYRARCHEQLVLYASLGSVAEGVADRLVEDVSVCDALVQRLTRAELEQVAAAVVRSAGHHAKERLIGEVLRAVPGQVDGADVREVVTALLGEA